MAQPTPTQLLPVLLLPQQINDLLAISNEGGIQGVIAFGSISGSQESAG